MKPLKDESQRRSSSTYIVKYEPRDDGSVEWRGVSDFTCTLTHTSVKSVYCTLQLQYTHTHTPDPSFSYKTQSALLLKQIFLKCIKLLNYSTQLIVQRN